MKKFWHPVLVIVLISVVLGAGILRRGHEWGDDWAWYVLQAKSIVEGSLDEFIEISDFTNYQSTTHLGPLAYPWGYPLILVPFYAWNGLSPLTLKIPGLIFFTGFLICLYLFAKSRLTQTESLLLVSLFAFNPLLLGFLDHILSDIPFLFFSMLTLYLVTRQSESRTRYALIGASAFFTTFLRATGLLLLGCFLVIEFFKLVAHRTDRELIKRIILNSFLVCAVFAVLWIANLLLNLWLLAPAYYLNFRIAHASEQIEAGLPRKVECELQGVALGQTALLLKGTKPGDGVRLTGFLAAKSIQSMQPMLHVERIEFMEGMNHGV